MRNPFAGGVVHDYPAIGRKAYRCAGCGLVNPWGPTWGRWTSVLDDETGLRADANGGDGWPVWCSPACRERVDTSHEYGARVARRARRTS